MTRTTGNESSRPPVPRWVWVIGPTAVVVLAVWLLMGALPSPDEVGGAHSSRSAGAVGSESAVAGRSASLAPTLAPTPAPTPHPIRRANAAWAAVPDGRVFLIGGFSDEGPLRSVAVFDRRNWASLPDLPEPRVGAAAFATSDGRLFVFGGRVGGEPVASTLVLEVGAEQWAPAAEMPAPGSGMAVAELGGLVYLLGGADAGHERDVVSFDPVGETWSVEPPLPDVVAAPEAAALDGSIFVFGTISGDGGAEVTAVYRWAPGGQWAAGSPLEASSTAISATAVAGRVWVIGPSVVLDGAPTTVHAYDPASDTWEPSPQPMTIEPGEWHLAVADSASTIFVVSGTGATTRTIGLDP